MALQITPIKFLRSLVYNKRPDPTKLLEGQPAINTNSDQPGLFFRDNNNSLFKVGPCAVGTSAPNAASQGGGGSNSLGELWLDQTEGLGPTLKVFDNNSWVPCTPVKYARVIVQDNAPNAAALDLPEGTLWWNSNTGLMYILFGDDPEGIWVQVGSAVSS